jgi:type I restriction enzyme S subunit
VTPLRPLKHVADVGFSSVDKKTIDGQIAVKLCNYTDVYYNERIVADMPFMEASATADQVATYSLRAGDVLITKDSETADDIGVSAHVPEDLPGVLCGYHLAIARPRPSVAEGRYLRWALAATGSRQQLEVAATGVTRFGLRQDAVAGMLIPVPALPEQRAIADYLDAGTARIDALVEAIRRSIELINERRRSSVMAVFVESGPRSSRGATVRAMADVLLGRQRSPEQAQGPHMVRYLRAANVKDGRLDLSDVMEMNFNPVEQQTFGLQPSDVLVTEGAGSLAAVGANAVWEGDLQGTICFQNTLLRLRARPGHDPRYLAWWARFAYESGLLASVASGANIYHLGAETARVLPAWVPSTARQVEVADRLDRDVSLLETQVNLRRRQVALLRERRQALITAAVTGELEVPGVAA